jgi:hypothetical protein
MNFLDEFINIPIDHQFYSESDVEASTYVDYAKDNVLNTERSELCYNLSIKENRKEVEDELDQWLNNFKKNESKNLE